MDINETDVKEGERIATTVREKIIQSGDQVLIQFIKKFPDESYGRLLEILDSSSKQKTQNNPDENQSFGKAA